MTYPIDAQAAKLFLRAIAPDAEKYVFQAYSDVLPPDAAVDPNARTAVGELDSVLYALQTVTDRRAAVCVQVNEGTQRGKHQITAIRAVFIDLDGGEAATVSEIAAVMPRPSAVVGTSPGKYHIYWRVTDCTLDQFKLVQVRLAAAFRADPSMCNKDRVMRLPGSWHFKSSTPTQVQLLAYSDCHYSTAALLACAESADVNGLVASKRPTRSRQALTDALMVVAEKFVLPDALKKGERVTLLVKHCGSLAGQGYSYEAIHAALASTNRTRCVPPLTNSEMETEVYPSIARFIAATARQTAATVMQPSAEFIAAAQQSIVAAQQVSIDDETPFGSVDAPRDSLDQFLTRYVLIEARSEVADLLCTQPHKSILKLNDFKNATANRRVSGVPLSTNWLMSRARKSVRDVIYWPKESRIIRQQGLEYYNIYSPTELAEADQYIPEKTTVFFDHMDFIFGANTPAQQTFLNWFAFTLQRPEQRIPWAPLIVGVPGTGKGWIYQLLQKLLGEQNCAMIRSDDLGERSAHNEWLSSTLLVCIDEMDSGSKWADMNRLKSILTEPYQIINKKYGAKGKERIFANFIGFANLLSAAALDENDRRFWVHQIPRKRAESPEYYTRLFAWLESDGPQHLLRWAMDYDLAEFNATAPPPMTAAKREMIEATRPQIERILTDAVDDAVGCFAGDVVSHQQVQAYVARAMDETKLPPAAVYPLRNAIQKKLTAAPQKKYRVERNGRHERLYLYIVRNAERWTAATADEIVVEYLRGLELEYSRPNNVIPMRK